MEYNGSTTLISGLKQANDGTFPLVDANSIQYKQERNEDGTYKSVDKKLEEIEIANDSKLDYANNDDLSKIVPNLFEEKIRITQSSKIDNTLNSDLIIDSIEGNYYQELGEVFPTPDKEIPIFSKKINVNGEIVELRSLKESGNLFDLGLLSKTELIPKTGAYRKIDIPLQLKPNTKYTFTYDPWEVPALSWVVLNIGAEDGKGLEGVFNCNNQGKSEALPQLAKKTIFTTSSTGYVYFNYFVSGDNVSHASLWFTKLLPNIMLVEGTTVPSTYIAPTIRDYKIVNHVNKKSWIERNVGLQSYTGGLGFNDWRGDQYRLIFSIADRKPLQKVGAPNILCNIAYPFASGINLKDVLWETGNTSLYWYPNIYSFGLSGTESIAYGNTKLNEFLAKTPMLIQYELATPVIEEIEYLESDTSEVGQSFQDSITPSPSVKSNVEFVDKLEIKTTGINILSNKLEDWYICKNFGWGATSGTPVPKPNTFSDINYFATIEINGILPNTKYSFYNENTKILWVSRIIEMDDNYIGYVNHRLYDSVELTNKVSYTFTTKPNTTRLYLQIRTIPAMGNGASRDITEEDIISMQITLSPGEVKEHYNYQESFISYMLEKPLLGIGNYRDILDLINVKRKNLIYELPKEQLICDISVYKKMTNCIRFGLFNTAFKPHISKDTEAVLCDMFKTLKSAWSIDTECIFLHDADNATKHMYISVKKERLAGYNDNLTNVEIVNLFKKFIQNTDIRIWWVLAEPTIEPLENGLIEKSKHLETYNPITNIIIKKVEPELSCRINKT